MSLRFIRQYSQSAFGFIKTNGPTISVNVAQPIQQLELFTSLKQNDRNEAFDKVLSAILFKQLSAHNRDLVFKPSKNTGGLMSDEVESATIQLGESETKVELTPRTFLGRPSRQDHRVIALTSHEADEITEAANYLQECLKSPKELGKNFDPVLTQMLLRRAAKAGNFEEVFSFITRNKKEFGPFIREQFNSEALRIYALRIPYLSVRSKSMLNKLYRRSQVGLGRELAYAYGLNAYTQKFGDEHKGHLLDTFKNIKELMKPFEENPRRALMKSASLTDLVMGYEAVANCKFEEAKELVAPLERFLERTSHHRELSTSIVLNIGENEPDALSEEEESA